MFDRKPNAADDVAEVVSGGPLFAVFGALVGIFYPPKSSAWRRWQVIGAVNGVLAFLAFTGAVVSVRFGSWSNWTTCLVGSGFLLLGVFVVVGNVCRRYHESQ